jgi:hypothetical protein
MSSTTERDIKILFARSMNRCAYPNCTTAIVQPSGTVTGEICHIKARSSKWPRYDPAQSDEQRHAYKNLILLCGNHHKIVDSEPAKYTVDLLNDFKEMHERNGSIELTQNDVQLVRKLIESHTEICAGENAQMLANSPNAVQINKPKKSRTSIKQTVVGRHNVVAGGDIIHTERLVKKNITQPGPLHITEEEAFEVKRLIDELAKIDTDSGRPDSHRTWYSWMYRKFEVTSYKTVPREKYADVISWLRQQKAINRKKLRRPANKKWRDQLFGAIYGRWRQLGFQKEDIYAFAFERLELAKPITSLTELGEQDLKGLYDIIYRLP